MTVGENELCVKCICVKVSTASLQVLGNRVYYRVYYELVLSFTNCHSRESGNPQSLCPLCKRLDSRLPAGRQVYTGMTGQKCSSIFGHGKPLIEIIHYNFIINLF